MKRLPITELRKNLFGLAEEVVERREPVVLTRRARKSLVLVSEDEWLCVNEKAAKYETGTRTKRPSMVGSLVLKTKDLEGDIRKIRAEFAASLDKAVGHRK